MPCLDHMRTEGLGWAVMLRSSRCLVKNQMLASAGATNDMCRVCMHMTKRKQNVPSSVRVLVVQLWPTLLAVVLVRTLALVHNADTPTMLPDRAAVTLDEQTARVVALHIGSAERLTERWAWVLLLAAYAARDFLFVNYCFLCVIITLRSVFLFGWLRALAATRWLAHVLA